MNRRNCKGFLMTFVIVAMAMMGVVLAVLTTGSSTMLFRADAAYLQAVERNLTASGLSWARAKLANGAGSNIEGPVKLDPDDFGASKAFVVVQLLGMHEGIATVRINTSCTKGRRTLDASGEYRIRLSE